VVGNANAIHGRGDHVYGKLGLEAAGLGLPRDHAHWVVGCQGDFMAQPRGLGCPLPFCPKLGGHREEREERGKLGLTRVAPVVSRGSGDLCRPCRY
jgi:hypothetical protein